MHKSGAVPSVAKKSGKTSLTEIKTKTKTKPKTKRVKLPPGGALRAPLAGSPACVFVFVFVLTYVEFEFSPPPTPQPQFQGVKIKITTKNEVWLK